MVKPKIYKRDGVHYVERKVYPLRDVETGKLILWHWIRMDAISIFLLIGLLIMAYGYVKDTETCSVIQEDPCGFFKGSVCYDLYTCQGVKEQSDTNQYNFTEVFESSQAGPD